MRPSFAFWWAVSCWGMLGTAACRSAAAPIAPEGLPPLSSAVAAAWVQEHVPGRPLRYELKWSYQTQRGRVRGRAVVLFVPPDSLRLNFQAPLRHRGAAVVLGDRVMWSRPEELGEKLIPIATLLWAALGVPRLPPPRAAISGRSLLEERVWRYATGDTILTYVSAVRSPPTLRAQLTRAGRLIGTTYVALNDSSNLPRSSRTLFAETGALFVFSVEAIETPSSVDSDIWNEP
ncbi:MAG: hypothetical protein O7D29_09995 [Gemmatimonadetes bacterium]|nr:hypothetical protein [Gemmatimonadota bacterium]